MMATYDRINESTLEVSLHEVNENGSEGATVFQHQMNARDVVNNSWVRFDFPPLASKSKRYRVKFSSPDATPSTSVTIWTNQAADGRFFRGAWKQKGVFILETLCAPGLGH